MKAETQGRSVTVEVAVVITPAEGEWPDGPMVWETWRKGTFRPRELWLHRTVVDGGKPKDRFSLLASRILKSGVLGAEVRGHVYSWNDVPEWMTAAIAEARAEADKAC